MFFQLLEKCFLYELPVITDSLTFTVAGQAFYRETNIDYYVLLILKQLYG